MYDTAVPPDTLQQGWLRQMRSPWFLYRGRIGRRRYWMLSITYSLAGLVGSAALVAIAIRFNADKSFLVALPLMVVLAVLMISTFTAVMSAGVRRLHDRGKSGFWLLAYYLAPSWTIPEIRLTAEGLAFMAITIGIIGWSLIDLGMLRGDAGSNAFGPDPLADASS